MGDFFLANKQQAGRSAYLKAMGEITLSWNQLRTSIESVVWRVAGLDPQWGRTFTNEAPTMFVLNTLKTLVNHIDNGGRKYKALLKVVKLVNAARSERNDIIHALWSFDADGSATIIEASATEQLKISGSPRYQTPNDVMEVNAKIQAADKALEAWIKVWRAPS